ncbi:MAG: hypothetical protein FWF75_02825 [Propionibacteriaceae bacterium]|nr:hypothetical protein [Propionibacteriaceae bacterium]
MELTLNEDGRGQVSIRRELFGVDGDPSAVECAVGQAVEGFVRGVHAHASDRASEVEALRDMNEVFTNSRREMVGKMADVEDYVMSMKAKIAMARARR